MPKSGLFKNDSNINVDGKLYAVPFTWGAFPMMRVHLPQGRYVCLAR